MNCPKQLRNGPCGGVRANGNCEVEPDMPCVWVQAWAGSRNMVHGDAILKVQKPVNQSLRETSSWLRVTAEGRRVGRDVPFGTEIMTSDINPHDPGAPLDPLPGHSSRGRLERCSGAANSPSPPELNPPDSADPQDVYERRGVWRRSTVSMPWMPRAPTATCPRSASVPAAWAMRRSCRSPAATRTASPSRATCSRASAMGVQNIMCPTGDGVQAGDQRAPARLRPRLHRRNRAHHARQIKIPVRPQAFHPAAGFPRGGHQSVRPALRLPPLPAGQEDRGRRAVRQSQYCFDVPMFREDT